MLNRWSLCDHMWLLFCYSRQDHFSFHPVNSVFEWMWTSGHNVWSIHNQAAGAPCSREPWVTVRPRVESPNQQSHILLQHGAPPVSLRRRSTQRRLPVFICWDSERRGVVYQLKCSSHHCNQQWMLSRVIKHTWSNGFTGVKVQNTILS